MAERSTLQHWPVIVLGTAVVAIFVAVLIAFEVKETEHAVVMTFGAAKTEVREGPTRVKVYEPGLHLKWPYPIDTVWRHDNRLHCYELKKGQVEQIQTADDYQIVVSTFVLWKVGDPGLFLKRVNTTAEAENKLDDVVRNSRSIVLGRHKLAELINVDPAKVRITEIEKEMLTGIHEGGIDIPGAREIALSKYGIEVQHLGLKHLGFPEKVSERVFDRMKAERSRISTQYLAEGESRAREIRAQAEQEKSDILAKAEAKAKQICGEGDETAARHYAVFRQNPELAAFLRKLDSLRKTFSEKTTLVVDTKTPPFDLLQPGATDLEKWAAGPAQKAEGQGGAK